MVCLLTAHATVVFWVARRLSLPSQTVSKNAYSSVREYPVVLLHNTQNPIASVSFSHHMPQQEPTNNVILQFEMMCLPLLPLLHKRLLLHNLLGVGVSFPY
ncbi:hypothetical protein EDB82DRAFT_486120 [Fusarium venenatum]|uniref:uncharacterized protein n=1 Tax=Fusarium venenatum TaxID=56646 RepID=UPI001D82684A|nr:hypothetical protein EDB82DRAFT_486120 [Fusarium venenatum]